MAKINFIEKLYALRGEIDHAGKLLRADMQRLLHGLLTDLTWQPAPAP